MGTKIAVLSYPIMHRKTFDVLSLLKAGGYSDVIVYAIPFHYEKKRQPLIQHRPEMNYRIPEPKIMCENLGYQYITGRIEDFHIESERIVLFAGAGILPDNFVQTHIVINSHPGYLPNCRGLDAFKWAILNDEPIGVTTHLVGEYVDAGFVIERREIEVFRADTFHALASRVYENEVSMLVESIKKLSQGTCTMILPGEHKLHKRMPACMEEKLLDLFEKYKKHHAKENG